MISTSNYPVSLNIRRIIREKGLKQVAVAKKADLTPQELGNILNDRRILKASEISRLACALEVPHNELFAEEGDDLDDTA